MNVAKSQLFKLSVLRCFKYFSLLGVMDFLVHLVEFFVAFSYFLLIIHLHRLKISLDLHILSQLIAHSLSASLPLIILLLLFILHYLLLL